MGYLIKAGVGLVLFFGAIYVFNDKLQVLLDTGTCASGNVPYEIAPGYQCPEGIEKDILAMVGSIFAGLIGAAIFAFRGDPPWGRRKSFGIFGWGTLAWGIFFAGTGVALLLGQPYGESVDPNTGEVVGRPDSQLGSTITAITFLVMGVPALLIGLWSAFKGLTGRRDEQPAASAGGGDQLGKIERLQKLRESGAITDSEFEREKAKILGT